MVYDGGYRWADGIDGQAMQQNEAKISVKAVDGLSFEVKVEGDSTTNHTVTVAPSYYQALTHGRVTTENLVEFSFRFLLERESNTSILSRFDLPLISRYFPEYGKTVKKWIDKTDRDDDH